MHVLDQFVIPYKNDAQVLAYYGKTENDIHFIEFQAVSYASSSITECIEFLNETYGLDVDNMITSIKTKKPVDSELTLLFKQNDEYLIFSGEVNV